MGFALFYFFVVIVTEVSSSADEYRLLQELKENYDYFERPIENSSRPLEIKVRLFLNQILDVDERNQVMTVMAWLQYNWTDYKLKWNPSDYGGITDIRFSGKDDTTAKLWRPDVLLFNSVAQTFDSTFSSHFVVKYNGEVIQNPPGILKFACDIDITWFPFDDQICFLKFGSWTYSGEFIDLDMDLTNLNIDSNDTEFSSTPIRDKDDPQNYFVHDSIDRAYYIVNGEWLLLNTPGVRVVKAFDGAPYHELYFYIRIRRRTLAYGINLIIPSVVISVMTVLGFTLPPEACEKVTLETTILLSVIFFLQMVSNMSPPSSDAIPILAAFFSCCLLVVSASVVFTVLVLNLQHRRAETHTMGPVLRYLLLELFPLLIMLKRPKQQIIRRRTPKMNDDSVLPIMRKTTVDNLSVMSVPCIAICRQGSAKSAEKHRETKTERIMVAIKKSLAQACIDLNLINKDFLAMSQKFEEQHEDHQLEGDWHFAAMVVDRLCLYLFSSFILISTCGLILPHFLNKLNQ
ncbi:Acetylcholine receptor subunit alpha-type acr-16 [Toxocara canis]|uniref:Acetylcholine receptor subunit alpha-type acr-16 n=1 Tax=Toxocara canis TaxID=6265 RepID=A0A0B2UV59_TOXCA|nr:Acetylcholine receptor subunit alpha-type acr-16 [Toxocara canis]